MTSRVFRSATPQGEPIPSILFVALQLASIATVAANPRAAAPRPVAFTIDSLYFAGNPSAALTLANDSAAAATESAELEWRAARSLIAIGMVESDAEQRRDLYSRALSHARRASSLAPDDVNSHYWLAAAAGRRTYRGEPLSSARLAREVYEHTMAILAIDSTHAGAHHALGMLHAEMLRVPSVLRTIGGRAFSNGLPKPNAGEAENHLRRAVELEPFTMIYLVDLARFYMRAGRRVEAHSLARQIASAPARHPMDEALRIAFNLEWRQTQGGERY